MADEIVGPGAPPEAVVRAVEENLFERWRFQDGWPQMRLRTAPDLASMTVCDVRSPVFNSVSGARFDAASADDRIAEVVDEYRGLDLPAQWWVTPSATPADLARRLVAHGFSHEDDMAGMAADLAGMDFDRALPSGVQVEEIRDASTLLEEWISIFAADMTWSSDVLRTYIESLAAPGFDSALPFRHFTARLDDGPVATSSVLCAGGAAGLFGMATVPWARHRGIGTAMALAAMRWGVGRGYKLGVTVATDMGRRVYASIGFREVCTVSLYRLPQA